jgi:5'-3' exonuclease
MTKTDKNRVLIIDALNMFLRAYIVDPSLSTNGEPIGGFKGSLKIVQKLVRMTKPDEVVIVWDGPNGSQKRRSLDKNYKAGRKPIRLNRNVKALTENEEMQNRIWQQQRSIEYFNEMPIVQVMLPEVEADDVISYLTRMPYYDGWQKVIVSNDKDFYQLCDEETIVYRPTSDAVYNKKKYRRGTGCASPKHGVSTCHGRRQPLTIYQELRRLGLKQFREDLGFLVPIRTILSMIFVYCEKVDKKLKFHNNILEGQDTIAHNYKMMQLYSPMFHPSRKTSLKMLLRTLSVISTR